jgi:hypothetical protein
MSQTHIGWNQLFFGRWSLQWIALQSAYLRRNKSHFSRRNHGTRWFSSIIKLIWTYCHDEWLARNNALHDHTQQTRKQARLNHTYFPIRFLYDLPHQCTSHVCSHSFHNYPGNRFAKEADLRSLENWLSIRKARILRHVTHRQHHL